MKLAVIGLGNVGTSLARHFEEHDHELVYYRKPRTDKIPDWMQGARYADTMAEAVAFAEVIVLCLPFDVIRTAIGEMGEISGKIIVDTTNLEAPDFKSLVYGNTNSCGEEMARMFPSAHVVKCFSATGWENLANPDYGDQKPVMPYAGDDPEAKQKVKTLVEHTGFEPFDVGELYMARFIEAMTIMWINPVRQMGLSPDFAWSVVTRGDTKLA